MYKCIKCGKEYENELFFDMCNECIHEYETLRQDRINEIRSDIYNEFDIMDMETPELNCTCGRDGIKNVVPFTICSVLKENNMYEHMICSKCRKCGGLYIFNSNHKSNIPVNIGRKDLGMVFKVSKKQDDIVRRPGYS